MTDLPKNIVASFVEEKLSGEIDRLREFCFADLRGTPHGVCPGMPRNRFDCDNTLLANAIYVLLWGGEGNVFPELSLENTGAGGRFAFRGDTMNSFRTVLGDISAVGRWAEYGMGEKVAAFYRTYHTIGNFVVLPNRRAALPGGGTDTFNTYRGGLDTWRDFFDRFLIELDKVFAGSEDRSADLCAIVAANGDAIRARRLPELAEPLFLRDYMNDDNTAPRTLFAPWSTARSFRRKIDDGAYREFASLFIDRSTAIISKRAAAICGELSRLL